MILSYKFLSSIFFQGFLFLHGRCDILSVCSKDTVWRFSSKVFRSFNCVHFLWGLLFLFALDFVFHVVSILVHLFFFFFKGKDGADVVALLGECLPWR